MTLHHGLRRALSASLLVSDAEGTLDNAALLQGQPDGDLKAFFSRTYETHEAAERAFCDAGGTLLSRTVSPGQSPVVALPLVVDSAGRVGLSIHGGGRGCVLALRFAIPHSSVG